MTEKTRAEIADMAGQLVGEAIVEIHRKTGIPAELILAGAHAQIVSMLAHSLGGPVAALCAEKAAERVRNMPSARALALARMPSAGAA